MKLVNAPIKIARRLFARPFAEPSEAGNPQFAREFTLLVDSGVVHINNVTGRQEGVTYSIMAEDADGKSTILKRTIHLAPYQAFCDEADGLHPLAVWGSKN